LTFPRARFNHRLEHFCPRPGLEGTTMRDGKTQVIKKVSTESMTISGFLESHTARLVVVSGANAGEEYPLDRERVTLGRGPGVDVTIGDTAMSRQHAAIDFSADGFRIHDLGSTNGLLLDDTPVEVAELTNGSRFQLGSHVFQLVIEEREPAPEVYELPYGS